MELVLLHNLLSRSGCPKTAKTVSTLYLVELVYHHRSILFLVFSISDPCTQLAAQANLLQFVGNTLALHDFNKTASTLRDQNGTSWQQLPTSTLQALKVRYYECANGQIGK